VLCVARGFAGVLLRPLAASKTLAKSQLLAAARMQS
jgi:hypothetical protein